MIFTNLNTVMDMRQYPPVIAEVLNYLKETDFETMPPGEFALQADKIFVQVIETQTQPIEKKQPESHEKFIDVQYLVKGNERLGVVANLGLYKVKEIIAERDLLFYESPIERETFLEAFPGCVSIFFPQDIHRPGLIAGEVEQIKKVVVKVSVALLKKRRK